MWPVPSYHAGINKGINVNLSETLTKRELEISVLVRDGLLSNEIADALGVRPTTVRNALGRIYTKTGLNRVQLAIAIEQMQRGENVNLGSAGTDRDTSTDTETRAS